MTFGMAYFWRAAITAAATTTLSTIVASTVATYV